MNISQNGLNLIKEFESFSATPYHCPAGKLTIGYGHVIKDDEKFSQITEEQANNILKSDCSQAVICINSRIKPELTQNQFDALVSFVFNVGCGNFNTSTLLRLLNSKNYQGAAEQFTRWIYANGVALPGLIKRRAKEQELFLS